VHVTRVARKNNFREGRAGRLERTRPGALITCRTKKEKTTGKVKLETASGRGVERASRDPKGSTRGCGVQLRDQRKRKRGETSDYRKGRPELLKKKKWRKKGDEKAQSELGSTRAS